MAQWPWFAVDGWCLMLSLCPHISICPAAQTVGPSMKASGWPQTRIWACKQASDLREADVICCILRPNFIVHIMCGKSRGYLLKENKALFVPKRVMLEVFTVNNSGTVWKKTFDLASPLQWCCWGSNWPFILTASLPLFPLLPCVHPWQSSLTVACVKLM